MFLGELCCLIVYFGKQWRNKSKEVVKDAGVPLSPGGALAEQVKMKTWINPLWLAIPTMCDLTGSTLMFVALTQCAASVYQMMRGIIVLVTAILSIIFLKRK